MVTTDPRTLIDDPNLSREYKEQLLQAWAASREEDEESWQSYFDEYGLDKRDRTPSADQRYAALLEDGSDAQTANASRNALGEHLRPDGLNVPDEMLDLGARGLEFFELFLPAAKKLGYESRELTDYYARFDAERGMRLNVLARDVDTLGRSLDTARTELVENERCVAAVRTGWSGVAAAAAIDAADRQNVQADATIGRLHGLAEVLFEANLTLSAAVTTKAYKVVSLHQPTVGGYSAAQIDVLAQIYADGKDGDNSAAKDCMEDASYWFPELADDDYRHVNGLYKDGGAGALRRLDRGDVVRRAAGVTKDWLDANFRHVYEEKQQEFTAACADCAEAVHAAYDAVIAEARSIEVQPGFRPEDTTDPAPAPRVPEVPYADTAPTAAPAPAPAPAAPTAPAAAPATDGSAYVPPRSGGGDAVTSPMAATPPMAAGPPVAAAPPTTAPPMAAAPPMVAVPPMPTAPGLGSIPGPGDLVRQGLAGGLVDLGSILRPLIEDTVSALTDRDDEERNTEDLGDEHADPREDDGESADGASHDKSLELNLDGKSWTLAVDADGQGIHLEMSDGQGGTARFGVEIGPDGLPQITAETAAGEGDSGDADCAPASPTPESQVSAGAADAPNATTEEAPTPGGAAADDVPDHENTPALAPDGDAAVPQPQVMSVQQEPVSETPVEAPPLQEPRSAPELATGPVAGFDSGAELAEAGPL
ncbi:hypothetical protein Pd630_LPD02824 [Rhodococcus opacus PD630]|nr:hypothetical protein Pd630_LPD02824 [Rhodococcus opacus PD630]UDG99740.1 hypothetical protein K2Z90_002701 [Rhodococcus opacus PD630]